MKSLPHCPQKVTLCPHSPFLSLHWVRLASLLTLPCKRLLVRAKNMKRSVGKCSFHVDYLNADSLFAPASFYPFLLEAKYNRIYYYRDFVARGRNPTWSTSNVKKMYGVFRASDICGLSPGAQVPTLLPTECWYLSCQGKHTTVKHGWHKLFSHGEETNTNFSNRYQSHGHGSLSAASSGPLACMHPSCAPACLLWKKL